MISVNDGDTGTEIVVDTGEDITTALMTKLKIKNPSGVTATRDASVVETTKLKYVAVAGEIVPGHYVVQPYLTIGTWTGHGDAAYFYCKALEV